MKITIKGALMKTALLSLILAFCACGDNAPIAPDAATADGAPDCGWPFPGYRECDWPYHEGDDCRLVCCGADDYWSDDNGGHFCSISLRKCTLVTPPLP